MLAPAKPNRLLAQSHWQPNLYLTAFRHSVVSGNFQDLDHNLVPLVGRSYFPKTRVKAPKQLPQPDPPRTAYW